MAAHYDSTPAGPGAADDAASVAAILETLRALKTQSTLQRDVICLFTDGEEAGLLGAEAFVTEHPWAKSVGLVLNFEYRGNSGPMLMFETSQGNGKLIAGFAAAVTQPLGNSLMYEVYKHLPNDTDMTVFKRAGMAGMNFAAIAGHTRYHTQLDRPDQLQRASLQHQGDILLALVQHFGNASLWLSTDKELDAWTQQFFPGKPEQRQMPEIMGDGAGNFWVATAPVVAVPAPDITVLSDATQADRRRLVIRVKSLRQAPKFIVAADGAEVRDVKVDGRSFSATPGEKWQLNAYGIAPEGLYIEFNIQAGSAFNIRVIDFSYGLPQHNFQPRSAGMIMQPFAWSDTLAVVRTLVIREMREIT